jgi:hypothetical protein
MIFIAVIASGLAIVRSAPRLWDIRLLKISIPATTCAFSLTFIKLAANEAFITLEDDGAERFSMTFLCLTATFAVGLMMFQGDLLKQLSHRYDGFTIYCGYYLWIS